MNSGALKVLQQETEFLSGVETNLETAKGKWLRGAIWQRTQDDELDRLKGLMAAHRNYDRELLKSLPTNRRVALHGFERRWFFGKKRTGVAIASVLTPLNHFAASSKEPPPPIGLGDLVHHIRSLVGNGGVPQLVGVCSPTGFTEEAKAARLDLPHVTVVLVEPDGQGGWRTSAASESVDPRILRLFDPENAGQKVDRVRRVLEERSADLLTGGVSLSAVAEELKLPKDVVRQALVQVSKSDPELRLSEKDGEVLLYRGAATQREERKRMGVIERIRQLFSGEGDEVAKINLLAERRAALAQRRDRIYEDIGKLEKKETDLLSQGKAATSDVIKRRLAAQLAQFRKDLARQNTMAAMLNQQINILSTDIHNLTLIQQGQLAQLPDTTELTENAVKAEELLETLRADSELVSGLTTGLQEMTTTDEEMAIFKEFETVQTPAVTAPSKAPTPAQSVKSQPVTQKPLPAQPEPPPSARRAGPEPTA
ncbi:MAG: hypothetical protein AABZ47_09410 [Planctomycetota bacterium]